jgi:sec-independent protein translocase protein TatA
MPDSLELAYELSGSPSEIRELVRPEDKERDDSDDQPVQRRERTIQRHLPSLRALDPAARRTVPGIYPEPWPNYPGHRARRLPLRVPPHLLNEEHIMTPVVGEIIGWELLLVIAVIALLFGAKSLPKLARSMGSAKTEFEKGLKEGNTEPEDDKA